MMLRVLAVFTLAAALSPHLSALHVKVLSVDYKAGRVTLLLPMHNATVEAVLPAEEPEIRVRRNRFYEAEIEPGQVNTVKRNFVRIKIPREGSVRFRVRKITFLE